MTPALDYGLELTNNSKVGWAFSLPRTETCVGATDLCKRLCYGNGVRYQTVGQKPNGGGTSGLASIYWLNVAQHYCQKIYR